MAGALEQTRAECGDRVRTQRGECVKIDRAPLCTRSRPRPSIRFRSAAILGRDSPCCVASPSSPPSRLTALQRDGRTASGPEGQEARGHCDARDSQALS